MHIDKVQRVMNAAARLVSGTRKFDRGLSSCPSSCTPSYTGLTCQRVKYKFGIMVYNCLHGQALHSFPVPDGCLSTSLQRRITARSTICRSTTAGSTPLQAWHICPASFRCGWPVGVKLATRLPEGYNSWQGHIQEALKDVIRTLLVHAAY